MNAAARRGQSQILLFNGTGKVPVGVTVSEWLRLRKLCRSDRNAADVWRQLERILASDSFARARANARKFLAFIVSRALLGRSQHLKETVIAIGVFQRLADFDSARSSTVRVAAASLRRRLGCFYCGEGYRDPILISIPSGTYVPRIARRIAAQERSDVSTRLTRNTKSRE